MNLLLLAAVIVFAIETIRTRSIIAAGLALLAAGHIWTIHT